MARLRLAWMAGNAIAPICFDDEREYSGSTHQPEVHEAAALPWRSPFTETRHVPLDARRLRSRVQADAGQPRRRAGEGRGARCGTQDRSGCLAAGAAVP